MAVYELKQELTDTMTSHAITLYTKSLRGILGQSSERKRDYNEFAAAIAVGPCDSCVCCRGVWGGSSNLQPGELASAGTTVGGWVGVACTGFQGCQAAYSSALGPP